MSVKIGVISLGCVKNSIDTEYEGKEIYLSVPEEVATAKEVYIDYKIRNKEYIVKVK